MSICVDPNFEATIAPSLIALLRGQDVPDEPPKEFGATFDEDVPADPASVEDHDTEVPTGIDGFAKTVLRQDGTRPLVLNAMCVWRDDIAVDEPDRPDRSIARHIGIYISDALDVLAHVSYEPADTLSARPVYRAAWIQDGSAFTQFLLSAGPELCFAAAHNAAAASPDLCALLSIEQAAHRPEALCLPGID